MASSHQVTVNGETFIARRGELLLDAALSNGVELPFNCRSGHCGTCCVRVVAGAVHGGAGAEPDVVHACQCRIVGDVVVEKDQPERARKVDGVLTSLRPLSGEVMEVAVRTDRALPYHAGQYAQVRFAGYPSRPFSFTHPLHGHADGRTVWFHMRRMAGGHVTPSLGRRIKPGHRVKLTGPYGAAYFRPNLDGRMFLVGTNTGFAPMWSVAAAALREDPQRTLMIIAGGRSIEALYMGPALVRLARFPNVYVVATCSSRQQVTAGVQHGRPTDYLPQLVASDVVYACGAPGMVDTVKSIAAHSGVVCHADPFIASGGDDAGESGGVLERAREWLSVPADWQIGSLSLDRLRSRSPSTERPLPTFRMAEARVRGHYRS